MTKTPPNLSRLWQHLDFIKECRAKRMSYRKISILINEMGTPISESGFVKFMARLQKRGGKAPFLYPEDNIKIKKPRAKAVASDTRHGWMKEITEPAKVDINIEELDMGFQDPTAKFMNKENN